jgi:hypothetical protein
MSEAKSPALDQLKRVRAKEPVKSTTVTIAVALSLPAMTVTVVVPAEIAVTMPSVVPTVAMAGSPDDQRSEMFAAPPVESVACATRRSEPPAMSDSAVGKMETETGGSSGRTETVAVAVSVPAVAVTVVEPGETAVTEPLLWPTVAMVWSADDHTNDTGTSRLLESWAVAVRVPPAPTTRFNAEGEMETPTGPNVVAVGSAPPPQPSSVIAAMTAMAGHLGRWPEA